MKKIASLAALALGATLTLGCRFEAGLTISSTPNPCYEALRVKDLPVEFEGETITHFSSAMFTQEILHSSRPGMDSSAQYFFDPETCHLKKVELANPTTQASYTSGPVFERASKHFDALIRELAVHVGDSQSQMERDYFAGTQ